MQEWSISLMEMTCFCIFIMWLLKRDFSTLTRSPLRPVLLMFVAFTGLVLLQLVPIPEAFLKLVSPSSFETYSKFGGSAVKAFHPVSINIYATRQELLRLLSSGAVFFVVASNYKTKQQVKSLAKTILFMGVFLAGLALLQKIFWNGRIFWFYPVKEALRSGAGIWGPYINRNHFAGYMEMAVPLGLGMLIYLAPAVKSLPGVPLKIKITRFLESDDLLPFALLFLSVLLMSALLLMTLSRSGITAFAVSSLFFAGITFRKRSLRNKTVALGVLGAALLAVVVFASWQKLGDRFEKLGQEAHISRLDVWRDSVSIVKDFSVLGSGLGTFENSFMRYQTTAPLVFFDHAHNDYIELLTDVGCAGFLIGAGTIFLFLAVVYKAWLRNRSLFSRCMGAGGLSSCVALGVHSFTDFNLHIPANALLFAIIAGLTYAVVFNSRESSGLNEGRHNAPQSPFKTRGGKGMGVSLLYPAAIFLLCAMVFLSARDLAADYYYRSVARLLDDKATEGIDIIGLSEQTLPRYVEAIDYLERAEALAPLRSAIPKAEADLEAKLGRWAVTMASMNNPLPKGLVSKAEAFKKAEALLKRAITLEPTNPENHLALGELYDSTRQDTRLADAELMKALDAYPVNVPLRYSVAMFYLLRGRNGEALEQARLLAKTDDSYLSPDSPRNTFARERRSDAYLSRLSNSYLFKALEIAWRISKDPHVVSGMAPDNADAREVVETFMEWKGIEF